MQTVFVAVQFIMFATVYGTTRRVELPFGTAVEGVTFVKGTNFLLSDTLNGRIVLFDSATNLFATVVQSEQGRTFQGIHYDKASGLILAAGSGPSFTQVNNDFLDETGNAFGFRYRWTKPSMHVLDLQSGKELVACDVPEGGLVNDAVSDDKGMYAYYTNSLRPWFYRLNLTAADEGKCDIEHFALPGVAFAGGSFYASGMAVYGNGVVIPNFIYNSIWYYDFDTKEAYEIVRGMYEYGNMVGVKVVYRRCLLAADNTGSGINVFRIKRNKKGVVSTKFSQRIESSDFSEPSTFDIRRRSMVVANFNNTELGAKGKLWLTVKSLQRPSALC